MRFLVIVPGNDESEAGVLPGPELIAAMNRYNEELVRAGVMIAAEGLHPTAKGAKVRFDGGKRTVTDGPFAETKELIAGFWIIEAKSREEAIEWVKRAPFDGGVEIVIRQVFETEDFRENLTPELRKKEEELRAEVERQQRARS